MALLIANQNYRGLTPLPGTEPDIIHMQNCLLKLGFRVFSFLNLAKSEMLRTIHEFCKMLSKGVYGKMLYLILPSNCPALISAPFAISIANHPERVHSYHF